MWSNCPPRYLRRELELLQPRIVLTIGRDDVIPALRGILSDIVDLDSRPSFTRFRGKLGDRSAEVLGCSHPSYNHWRESYPSMIESLNSSPLPQAD
jgi:hypothetical protein